MHNNLYSKDPFGVFNDTPNNSGFGSFQKPYFQPYRPAENSSFSWGKAIGVFLLIIGFGSVLYFKDMLVESFKKMISEVNDKVNPELKTELIAEEKKPEPKLLTESVEPKIERYFLIADKANWDIPYINQKQQERKAIYVEGKGWTIYE
jgi:hypothetical protein